MTERVCFAINNTRFKTPCRIISNNRTVPGSPKFPSFEKGGEEASNGLAVQPLRGM